MEPKKVTLRECIDITLKFQKGEINADELGAFGKNISIRAYVPMLEKLSSIMRLLLQYEITDVGNTGIKFVELYRNIFFYVELQLYAQIDLEDQADLISYETMDILYPIFHPFIKSYCEEDLNTYKELIRDCLNFNSLLDISNALGSLTPEALAEQTKAQKELVDSLNTNKDLIKDLKDIHLATDDMTKKVVKQMKDLTVREITDAAKLKMAKEHEEKLAKSKADKAEVKTETKVEETKTEEVKTEVKEETPAVSAPPKKRPGRPKKTTTVTITEEKPS